MDAFWKGIVLGFSIAAPVGPIGLLVLRRSLTSGMRAGFICGLGAAAADLCYGALAVLGVTMLAAWQRPAAVIGGLLLFWLAWQTLRSEPGTEAAQGSGFWSTFLLTVSNPMTILAFAAMVAGVGATAPVWFVGGVFTGSMIWWAILSTSASLMRQRVTPVAFVWINRVAACVLFGFGLSVIGRPFWDVW
ncbi:LysE family transporter [uncultured Paludibaculum sp.]|uniref:LysE family translocator n=1 Tax=uncultured Paludibaculum sp. TaxID=1765020 RepID=UPI002AABDF4C|nr:LysE family transporter [uncultured Paludibaculum sp.]